MCVGPYRVALSFLSVFLVCIATPARSQANAAPAVQAAPVTAAQKPAYESDPRFIAAMAEANRLSLTEALNVAIEDYKKANKIAGGRCALCLDRLATFQIKVGSFKDAAASAAQLVALCGTPLDRSAAETQRGEALYLEGGDKPKPTQLLAADEQLKAALADYPTNVAAHFFDGMVLARMGQMDAAREQFQSSLAAARPTDPAYLRAKRFAQNPALSFQKMAPSFTVTALDGSKFTLDAMGGRVVLIDFWATWCGPCNEELPQMKKIAKDFAGQPLVIISVSWDDDEKKWKDFIAKNEMAWVQYRDADHELSRRFGIDAIPHYFTIDSDGVLTAEMVGSGYDVEGRLKKLVARAKMGEPTATRGGN